MNDTGTRALERIAAALELQALTALTRELGDRERLTHLNHRIDQLTGYASEGEG